MHHYFLKIRCLIVGILLLGNASPAVSSTGVHDVVLFNTPALASLAEKIASNASAAVYSRADISVTLSTMGQDLTLQLRPSRLNALALKHDVSDQPTVFFEGTIEGDLESWARLSMQGEKLNGHFYHLGAFYQLEHRDYLESLFLTHSGNSNHVLLEPGASADGRRLLSGFLPQADYIKFAPSDAIRSRSSFDSLINQKRLNNKPAEQTPPVGTEALPALSILKMDTQTPGVTRALRAGIFVDSRFNETHQQRGLARALTIMSAVDAIYQSQLGIAVIVDSIQVYEDASIDPMRDKGGTVGEILDNFREVRLQEPNLPIDLSLVHLFTGHRDPNRVIGLGWKGTLCRLDGYDISVSTPFPYDTLLAAHELAHNLGAVHDGDLQCNVEAETPSNTLMWPEISSTSTSTFSACSLVAMQEAKNRSCNWDNIDAAIDIRTYPSSETLRRSVVVEVSNNDFLGRSTELFSSTQFPAGTQFDDLSAGCVLFETNVECNHGRVQAATSSAIAVSATLPDAFTENVTTHVELVNASDTYDNDNRKAILMLQSIDATDQLFATDSSVIADDQSISSGDFVTRLGNPSAWLLLGLAAVGGLRTRAPKTNA